MRDMIGNRYDAISNVHQKIAKKKGSGSGSNSIMNVNTLNTCSIKVRRPLRLGASSSFLGFFEPEQPGLLGVLIR